MKASDQFYLQFDEPISGCLLAMREIILQQDHAVSAVWKYGMPFFCYKGKMFCYLWYHKKFKQPYLGLVEGKHFNNHGLLQEKRSRMKIMLLDPNKDLPVAVLNKLLQQALDLYRSGEIEIPGNR